MATNNRELYVSLMKKKLQQQSKKQTNIKGEKQKNTKTFHKVKYTQRTNAMNTISRNIKNINHMKNKGKTTVK